MKIACQYRLYFHPVCELTANFQVDHPDFFPGVGGYLAEVDAGVRGPQVRDPDGPVGGVLEAGLHPPLLGVRRIADGEQVQPKVVLVRDAVRFGLVRPGDLREVKGGGHEN